MKRADPLHLFTVFHGNLDFTAGADVEAQPRKGLTRLCNDEHDSPIGSAEDPVKGFFVGQARAWAIARVRVNPNSGKLLRPATVIDLSVKEIGN